MSGKLKLDFSNTLTNLDDTLAETILELTSRPKSTSSCFSEDIDDFIKKYSSQEISSIEDLLNNPTSSTYFTEEEVPDFKSSLDSLLQK